MTPAQVFGTGEAEMATDGSGGRSKLLTFWTTLPGLVSAVAALITALAGAGILVATNQPSGTPTDTASVPASSSVSSSAPSDRPTASASVSASAEPTPQEPTPNQVTISLLVGLRPQLGQLAEAAELLLDGKSVATWTASAQVPNRTLKLDRISEGRHSYELRGEYSYVNAFGVPESQPVAGTGSVTINEGDRYAIEYLGQNLFRLTLLP